MNYNINLSFNICCYNSEKFIRETLDSIINQTYENWEIVIVDDGSTDNTSKIIHEYIKKGVLINYYKQENKGFGNARNKAIELSKNDWIVIIDHDDICEKDRLLKHLHQIQDNPNCKLFFGDTVHFDINNNIITNHFKKI